MYVLLPAFGLVLLLRLVRAGLRPALFLLALGSVSVDLSGHDSKNECEKDVEH